jgi:outer membrane protein assembly factor BamC
MKQFEQAKRHLNIKMVFTATALAVASASGCSFLPNHHLDYRNAESIEPMTVPEGMVFIGEQAQYPVPEGKPKPEYESAKKDTIPKPPQLLIQDVVEEDDAPLPEEGVDATNTRVVMARDGNGYPIIMMHTPFSWAWEYVSQALSATDLKIDDRDRDSGTFYIKTPKKYEIDGREVQVKLSHTANGIQIAVLNKKGTSLLDKASGQKVIQRLYDEL